MFLFAPIQENKDSYQMCETMFFKAFIALKETFPLNTYRKISAHIKEYFMDSEICTIGTKIFLLTLYATIDQISL